MPAGRDWIARDCRSEIPAANGPLVDVRVRWKTLRVLDFGLPKLWANQLKGYFASGLKSTMVGVVLMPLVIPWEYAWCYYVQRAGDRWK